MAFKDLDEALGELGYGDVHGASIAHVDQKKNLKLAREKDRYKLDGQQRRKHNERRRIGCGKKRLWWSLPEQRQSKPLGRHVVIWQAATQLARQRAEAWA